MRAALCPVALAACTSPAHPAPAEPRESPASIDVAEPAPPPTPTDAPPPTPTPPPPEPPKTDESSSPPVHAIAVGEHLSCALLAGGEVRCWGATRLAAIPFTARPMPIGISDAVSISLGERHACAARADGTVVCWGDNRDGQIGDGTTNAATTLTPVPGLSNIVEVAAGGAHTCARDRDGAVYCWGHAGCVGHPREQEAKRPGLVKMPPAKGLVIGDDITCALFDGAPARCWGFNTTMLLQPHLGPVARAIVSKPLEKATTFALGNRHVCATFDDGHVYCAGSDHQGQLGDHDVPNYAMCDPYDGRKVTCKWTERLPPEPPPERDAPPRPTVYPPPPGRAPKQEAREYPNKQWFVPARGVRATALAAGYGRSCAITPERTVTCWGQWYFGIDWAYRQPSPIAGVGDVVAIAVAREHACALKADRSLMCWGFNRSGELGNGELTDHVEAVPAAPVRW